MEKYEFVKDIGSGNFAVAKLMRNTETKDLVAVKYLDRGSNINDRAASEIVNHFSLSHPNIITFREVFLTPTHLAIVMDYADGGDLFDVVQNAERLSEDEARYFFQQIISGISHCHSMQICHRDLKLENVLIERKSQSPRLKICDFGFSKCLLYSRARSTVGSPGYFAPEVFLEQDYDGKLADVWSCGVIMYVMVVGTLPFQDQCDEFNIKEMLNRITNVRYEIPNYVHVSEDFRDLLSRIFVFEPSRRITMEEIKKHPWFLRKLPREIMEEEERRSERGATTSSSCSCVQREEEILKIVREAKSVMDPLASQSVGGFGGAKEETSMRERESKNSVAVPRVFKRTSF